MAEPKLPAWMQGAETDGDDFIKVTKPFLAPMEIKNIVDLSSAPHAGQYKRILIMGDSGSGKTRFIGTMPKPFVCDFDRGLNTLQGKPVKAMAFGPDDWNAFAAEVKAWKEGALYGCETFCVDSLSMASEATMNAVMTKAGLYGGQPRVQDWGEAIRKMKDMLGHITTLPCHVVVTAHWQLVRDEMLGDIQYVPLIFGKNLPHLLGIWFDEVYSTIVRTKIEGTAYSTSYDLQVKPDARSRIIKSRMNSTGTLFDQYEVPDFNHLQKKVTDHGKE